MGGRRGTLVYYFCLLAESASSTWRGSMPISSSVSHPACHAHLAKSRRTRGGVLLIVKNGHSAARRIQLQDACSILWIRNEACSFGLLVVRQTCCCAGAGVLVCWCAGAARTPSTHGLFDFHFSSNIDFEVINPHTVGSLTIPRAGIKWV